MTLTLVVPERGDDSAILTEALAGPAEPAPPTTPRITTPRIITHVCDPEAPDAAVLRGLMQAPAGPVVFWRTEAVAARMLALGLKGAVIVPSATPRRAAYWQTFVGAGRFLTLSRPLHERLEAHACRSAFFDWWPAPPQTARPRSTDPKDWRAVFLDDGAPGLPNPRSVAQQCRALGIADLTVIDVRAETAPESPLADSPLADPTLADPTLANGCAGQPLPAALEEALFVFAAPRPGLGAAMRHAMARGQIVVAPDMAPASEIVSHLSSGLLTDPARPAALPALDAATAARLAEGARGKAAAGHRRWRADRERLVSLVTDDGRRWAGSDASAHLGNAIQQAMARRRAM